MFTTELEVFVASIVSFAAVAILLLAAGQVHRRRLAAVPVRVHIGGSRGKTTTSRLIGAGLRAGGYRVLVKTTGTEPLLILPDGSEQPWWRPGLPRIGELIRFFKVAAGLGVDAVVLESMAIEPEYLWASEHYLVHATHVAVTNVRPDHEEALQSGQQAIAESISLTMPQGGRVFLTDESAEPPIIRTCEAAGCKVKIVATENVIPLETNRRLALEVCSALGVPSEIVIPAMDGAGDDPGAFFITEAGGSGRRFASAFACNDIMSFMKVWAAYRPQEPTVVLLNARVDRPLRTNAFLKTLAGLQPPVQLVLSHGVPKRWALAAGFEPGRVRHLVAKDAGAAIGELFALTKPGGTVWGVGNYAGLGARIVEHLRR